MAPELFQDGGCHSFASDLWALGCVMYECCAGRPPFVSSSFTQLVTSILTDPPPPLAHGVSPEFSDLVMRLLTKDVESRITWDELLTHRLWKVKPERLALPPQPALEEFIRNKQAGAGMGLSPAIAPAMPEVPVKETAPPVIVAAERQPVAVAGVAKVPGTSAVAGVGAARDIAGGGAAAPVALGAKGVLGPAGVATGVAAPAGAAGRVVDSSMRRLSQPVDSNTNDDGAGGEDDINMGMTRANSAVAGARLGAGGPAGAVGAGMGLGSAGHVSDASKKGSVNVMRLSLVVKRNLDKQSNEGEYNQRGGSGGVRSGAGGGSNDSGGGASEVTLANLDEELNFDEEVGDEEEDMSEDDDEDGSSRAGQDSPGVGGTPRVPFTDGSEFAHTGVKGAPSSAATLGADGRDLVPVPGPRSAAPPVKVGPSPGGGISTPGTATPSTASATPQSSSPVAGAVLDGKGTAGDGGLGFEDLEGGEEMDWDAELESLLWHPSDSAVKPIVLNKRIEKVVDPPWDAKALPFRPLSLEEMMSSEQADLEAFLTLVYKSVGGATPINEKVNTLAYFESLCKDTGAANLLINSLLATLFVKQLKSSKAPALRVRLSSVLGLLVRHATYIAEEFGATGVVSVLAELLREKNERVRRRAMSTLGEILFYVASQQQDTAAAAAATDGDAGAAAAAVGEIWQVPPTAISLITRLIRPGEEEICQHYAVKTIENVASQGGEWTRRFASQEVVYNLIQVFNGNRGEHLRASAVSSVARILRHSPPLVAYVVERLGVKLLLKGLGDPNAKIQQAFLCVINAALAGESAPRAKAALSEYKSTVPMLLAFLEHPSAPLRGKALLCLALLLRSSPRWLLAACNAKLMAAFDRLGREQDTHMRRCARVLVHTVAAVVPDLVGQTVAEVDRLRGGRPQRPSSTGGGTGSAPATPPHPASGGTPRTLPAVAAAGVPAPSASKSALMYFPALLHLVTSPALRPHIVTTPLLKSLSWLLAHFESVPPTTPGAAEFQFTLLHVVEALSQPACAPLLLSHARAVTGQLLPTLAGVIGSTKSGDVRFLCLKIITDIVTLFLAEAGGPSTPRGAVAKEDKDGSAPVPPQELRAALDSMVQGELLPLYPDLLVDEDPVPLYALKLLVLVLEHNGGLIREVTRLGLAPRLFEFLSLEHANNNVHNVRLCCMVLASGALDTPALVTLNVVSKVNAVLAYASENAVESFLEPMLDMVQALLQHTARAVGSTSAGGAREAAVTPQGSVLLSEMGRLLGCMPIFVELAAHADISTAEASVRCLSLATTAMPCPAAAALLAPACIPGIVHALAFHQQQAGQAHGPLGGAGFNALAAAAPGSPSSSRVLAVLLHGLGTAFRTAASCTLPAPIASAAELAPLEGSLARLRVAADASISSAASEAGVLLQHVLRQR
eukprot:jgi/Mesvir1/20506/Mv12390-RA.3